MNSTPGPEPQGLILEKPAWPRLLHGLAGTAQAVTTVPVSANTGITGRPQMGQVAPHSPSGPGHPQSPCSPPRMLLPGPYPLPPAPAPRTAASGRGPMPAVLGMGLVDGPQPVQAHGNWHQGPLKLGFPLWTQPTVSLKLPQSQLPGTGCSCPGVSPSPGRPSQPSRSSLDTQVLTRRGRSAEWQGAQDAAKFTPDAPSPEAVFVQGVYSVPHGSVLSAMYHRPPVTALPLQVGLLLGTCS